jgi:ubiquitin carboxyl-terminal hydrolase 7
LQGEKFTQTRERLQARTGATDKEIAKWRFALILTETSGYKQPNYIEDSACPVSRSPCLACTRGQGNADLLLSACHSGDDLSVHKWQPQHLLGIDHIDRTGKSSRSQEKAIVIR